MATDQNGILLDTFYISHQNYQGEWQKLGLILEYFKNLINQRMITIKIVVLYHFFNKDIFQKFSAYF